MLGDTSKQRDVYWYEDVTSEHLKKGRPSKPGPSEEFPRLSCPNECGWNICCHKDVADVNLQEHLAKACPQIQASEEEMEAAKRLAAQSFEELIPAITIEEYRAHVREEREGLRQYPSGMVRSDNDGKINWALALDGPLIERLAVHLTNAASEKGKRNWMEAHTEEDYERFRESFVRHVFQYLDGDQSEDHFAALIFNANGMEYVRQRMA